MGRLVKLLVVLALVGGAVLLASYVGARATVGKLLGSQPPSMGERVIELAWKGSEDLPGKPRVWVFRYSPTAIPGAREVRVYVSLGGNIIETRPRDLDQRLNDLQRDQLP